MAELRLEHIYKTYKGGVEAVKDLNLTVRDGEFLVVGYSYDSYDTLDLDAGRNCSADFEAGTGLLDGVPFTVTTPAVPLVDWEPAMVPPECAAG